MSEANQNERIVICNQAHICKKEPCNHKSPHAHKCANPMPCRDFQIVAGKIPDKELVPISACVGVSTDGHYLTVKKTLCPCCGGLGEFSETEKHEAYR